MPDKKKAQPSRPRNWAQRAGSIATEVAKSANGVASVLKAIGTIISIVKNTNPDTWYTQQGMITPAANISRPMNAGALAYMDTNMTKAAVPPVVHTYFDWVDWPDSLAIDMAVHEIYLQIRRNLKSNLPYGEKEVKVVLINSIWYYIFGKQSEKLLGWAEYTHPDVPAFQEIHRSNPVFSINSGNIANVTEKYPMFADNNSYSIALSDQPVYNRFLKEMLIPMNMADMIAHYFGSYFTDQTDPCSLQYYDNIMVNAPYCKNTMGKGSTLSETDIIVENRNLLSYTYSDLLPEMQNFVTSFGMVLADMRKVMNMATPYIVEQHQYAPYLIDDPTYFQALVNAYTDNSAQLDTPNYYRLDYTEGSKYDSLTTYLFLGALQIQETGGRTAPLFKPLGQAVVWYSAGISTMPASIDEGQTSIYSGLSVTTEATDIQLAEGVWSFFVTTDAQVVTKVNTSATADRAVLRMNTNVFTANFTGLGAASGGFTMNNYDVSVPSLPNYGAFFKLIVRNIVNYSQLAQLSTRAYHIMGVLDAQEHVYLCTYINHVAESSDHDMTFLKVRKGGAAIVKFNNLDMERVALYYGPMDGSYFVSTYGYGENPVNILCDNNDLIVSNLSLDGVPTGDIGTLPELIKQTFTPEYMLSGEETTYGYFINWTTGYNNQFTPMNADGLTVYALSPMTQRMENNNIIQYGSVFRRSPGYQPVDRVAFNLIDNVSNLIVASSRTNFGPSSPLTVTASITATLMTVNTIADAPVTSVSMSGISGYAWYTEVVDKHIPITLQEIIQVDLMTGNSGMFTSYSHSTRKGKVLLKEQYIPFLYNIYDLNPVTYKMTTSLLSVSTRTQSRDKGDNHSK